MTLLTSPESIHTANAYLSLDRKHRLWLSRLWDEATSYALFIGLNPSTADEKKDDPTVRREVNFCRSWGLTGYWKLNLFTWRATQPSDLLLAHKSGEPVVDPTNHANIRKLALQASKVIIATGNVHPLLQPQLREVQRLFHRGTLQCFGHTEAGFAKHPLYLKRNAELQPYKPFWDKKGLPCAISS